MTLPNFLIVGAAKCGTTTLHRWLRQHPDVFMPHDKEPTYFVRSIPKKVSFEEYTSLFKDGYLKIGEASVAYLYDEFSPILIKRSLGSEIKIIICIRNPADMAYSLWKHNVREQVEHLSFHDAIRIENDRKTSKGFRTAHPNNHINFYYTHRARFGEQIFRYYEVFGKENTLIVRLEDIANTSEKTGRDILRFLDLKSFEAQFTRENVSGGLYSVTLDRMLKDSSCLVRKPFKLLPQKIRKRIWFFLYYSNRNRNGSIFPSMPDDIRCEIMDALRDDLKLLKELTGISYE